jgi:hypothetical protein
MVPASLQRLVEVLAMHASVSVFGFGKDSISSRVALRQNLYVLIKPAQLPYPIQ